MRSLLWITSLCFVVFAESTSNTEEASKVHVLNKKTFAEDVQDSKNLWIVRYAETEEIESGFEEAASALFEYGIYFGVVDCSSEMNVCRQSNLHGLPSVRYFTKLPEVNPYTKRPYRQGQTYTGKLTAKSLKKLASRKMPDYVTKTKSDSLRAIFVTSKDKISPLMKAVAIHFHNRLSIGHVNYNTDSTYGDTTRLVLVSSEEEEVEKSFELDKKTTVSEIIRLLKPFASETKQETYVGGVHQIVSMSQIEDEHSAWVVAFVNDDGLQDKLVGAASEAASAGLVHVGVVKCNEHSNKDLCKDIKIPSVATYKFGKKKSRPRFFDTNLDKALKHARSSVPNYVQMGMEAMMDQYLVASIQKEKIATFYLSNEDSNVPTAFQSSCALFKDDIECVSISNPSQSLLERFSLQKVKLPQLFAVLAVGDPRAESNEQQVQFQLISFAGDPGVFDEIVQFAETLVKTIIPQVFPNRNTQKRDEEEDAVVSSVEKEFAELTAANFQEACKKPCVVAFLEDTTSTTVETLKQAHEKFKSAFDFYFVNGACQHEFAKSFDIETYMMPAVALWARDKGKMVKMLGSYSVDSIHTFLRGVRRGKHVPVTLESEPQSLVESCEVMVDGVEEDDIDLADILADIKKDEQMERERQLGEDMSDDVPSDIDEDANPEWTDRLKELNKKSKKRKRKKKRKKRKKKKKRRSEL